MAACSVADSSPGPSRICTRSASSPAGRGWAAVGCEQSTLLTLTVSASGRSSLFMKQETPFMASVGRAAPLEQGTEVAGDLPVPSLAPALQVARVAATLAAEQVVEGALLFARRGRVW